MKTYTVPRTDGTTDTRKGHIVRVAGVDLALHKIKGGYACDHARSGRAIKQLDALAPWGKPVTLAEAKENLADPDTAALIESNRAVFGGAPTLNGGFA